MRLMGSRAVRFASIFIRRTFVKFLPIR